MSTINIFTIFLVVLLNWITPYPLPRSAANPLRYPLRPGYSFIDDYSEYKMEKDHAQQRSHLWKIMRMKNKILNPRDLNERCHDLARYAGIFCFLEKQEKRQCL